MYHRSFRELQTDYIDYYLLHSIGGSMEEFRSRYIDNGILDFLIEERKAGRIRNLGWSFHGRKEVFDQILAMHAAGALGLWADTDELPDWRNARGNNVNAEYLYAELEKRSIPIVIMEPLLGGRLSNVPDHIAARLKTARPGEQRGLVGVPLCRKQGHDPDGAERHDLHGASAGQHPHLCRWSR